MPLSPDTFCVVIIMNNHQKSIILFVCDGLPLGGKERRFVQLVKGLNQKKYGELHLLMLRDVLAYDYIYQYDIKISVIERSKFGFVTRFYRYINRLKPDIIQSWDFMPMVYYDLMNPFLRFPHSYSISTAADCNFHLIPIRKKFFYRWSYLLADKIVGNSEAGLNSYQVPESKKVCIYNGFDENRLKKDNDKDIRKELNISTRYVISMIARFSNTKDWSMFLETSMRLIDESFDATFLAVGDGETLAEMRNMVPENYLSKIRFLRKRNDVEAILRATDISVLCTNSNVHGEGISNSILESFAFGVPVIATIGGGTSEIVENDFNGKLIQPHDMNQLSSTIISMLNNKEMLSVFKKNAIMTVHEKFSLECSTSRYIDIFNEMRQ